MKYKVATAAAIAGRFLCSGDAVLEIGAADGEYTRVYADCVGATGSVVAVEPDRRSAELVRQACVARPWVTVQPVAVGAAVSEAVLHTNRAKPKRSSLWSANVSDPCEAYPVAVTTVDALVRAMPRVPRLIAVDAQGAEASIVDGAGMTLMLPIVWVIEVWVTGLKHAGADVCDVLTPFQAHGYTARSPLGAMIEWPDALAYASSRVGVAHADFVMVPDDLMEAGW